MMRIIQMIGKKFGRLTVLKRAEDYIQPNGKHGIKYLCKCECGNEIEVLGELLRNGHTTSCGCKRNEILITRCSKQNRYEFTGPYVKIYFYNTPEKFAIIDKEDFEKIKHYCWSLEPNGKYAQARLRGQKKTILMHNIIMNDKFIDHKNNIGTDNRKSNLRKATCQQNNFNTGPQANNKLQVKGVMKIGNKYQARINKKYIGTFNTIKEAADAYDTKAKELFGEFAWLNNYKRN